MAKILVVDDDDHFRLMLSDCLLELKHEVTAASSCAQALELFSQAGAKPYKLVITDLVMPNQDGRELLHKIKTTSPLTPVIVLTGKGSMEAAVECLKTGAADFLTKPVELKRLEEAVRVCLRKAQDKDMTVALSINQNLSAICGYKIKRTLGYGTFAIVYLAERTVAGERREVALKVLKNDLFDVTGPGAAKPEKEEQRLRFSREAAAAAGIQHPNIVRIYEYKVATKREKFDLPFIAMEYIPGQSLQKRLAELIKLSYREKTLIIRQIAAALQAIHACNLCHRDIKPHNVMIDQKLKVKLTDFGIVKIPDSELTHASLLMGTPVYMAPEAFESPLVDARADLFSLGVMAYQLFLGKLPFAGEAIPAVARSVCHDRPLKPRKLDPRFPPILQDILARLLKKKPAKRYQSATKLICELDKFLSTDYSNRRILSMINREVLARDWS